MDLLRGTTLYIVVILGLLAVPAAAHAQMTSGEKNSPVADAASRDDAAALQKKANEAQARIHANKDDRDQLMTAVKTNEGTHWPNKFFSEMDSPLKIWKMRRLPFGSAEER